MNSGKSIPLMMDVRLTNRPERMLNGGFKNLPPDSWKPFGNGVRGCIGRPFAWQEVLLLVAMVRLPFLSCTMIADGQIFQSLDIRPHNPDYKLQIKHTITLKPRDFYMHASPRKGRDVSTIIGIGANKAVTKEVNGNEHTNGTTGKVDLSVFYGESAFPY
jgi:cytochrome P450/NADPH-cytochrome P450 reductase